MPRQYVDITPNPGILQALADWPLPEWACVAELTDNAVDAILYNGEGKQGDSIRINVSKDGDDRVLVIEDDGPGMTPDEAVEAVKAGASGKPRHGRLGLFGVGFNIATARLGRVTTIRTATRSSNAWYVVEIDVQKIRQQNKFRAPAQSEPKQSASDHGTKVTIRLNPEFKDFFAHKRNLDDLRRRLGDIYSYVLRDKVPGLSDSDLSGSVRIDLELGGLKVTPRIPCIWSEERYTRFGREEEVCAVQRVNRPLSPIWSCQLCGHMSGAQRSPSLDCEKCRASAMVAVDRKIRGWLGVQRYLETEDYGIDFLRHGRKILIRNKDLFVWTDPDTGYTEREYPVERPARMGRIVGEIHLDYIPPSPDKTRFSAANGDWQRAVAFLRGDTPLQPHKSKYRNRSPLAALFNVFRRNDAGTKRLMPGDGKGSSIKAAQNWGKKFHQGDPAYEDDSKWWEAAQFHEEQVNQPPTTDEGKRGSLADLLPPDGDIGNGEKREAPITSDRSTDEKIELYQAAGKKNVPLCTDLAVPTLKNRDWELEAWSTTEAIQIGEQQVPVWVVRRHGNKLLAFASRNHSLFSSYNQPERDMLLLEVASYLQTLDSKGRKAPLTQVLADILDNFPDWVLTRDSVAKRIEDLRLCIARRLTVILGDRSETVWKDLPEQAREHCEKARASATGDERLIDQSAFFRFLDWPGILAIINNQLEDVFDGAVFSRATQGFEFPQARERVRHPVLSALKFISVMERTSLDWDSFEIRQLELHAEFLEHEAVSEEDS